MEVSYSKDKLFIENVSPEDIDGMADLDKADMLNRRLDGEFLRCKGLDGERSKLCFTKAIDDAGSKFEDKEAFGRKLEAAAGRINPKGEVRDYLADLKRRKIYMEYD